SARFAGPGASDEENNRYLLEQLKAVPESQRSARYHCVIVYLRTAQDPMPLICQGSWEGMIVLTPKGEQGFGYDPLFYVPTHHCTSAELPPEVKNQLSHRGQALQALQTALTTIYND
ncbi:MAG: non-canonical purine NTP pyrophosphatase, partial [Pseudomonadota bacterium]|nr:non-canonical purine NTP pyrophosphatase [Pseudomonadota bacterium]